MSNVCFGIADIGLWTLDIGLEPENQKGNPGALGCHLVLTTGDEGWGSPAVARGGIVDSAKRCYHFNDFVFSLRQLAPGAIACEFTLDRALLPRLQ